MNTIEGKRKIVVSILLSLLGIIMGIPSYSQVTIMMEKRGNVFYIPGKINGLSLEFIFDTGASKCFLSATEALFMLKNGYLDKRDISGKSRAQIGDGTIMENVDVVLRELEIAGVKLHNVSASIVQNLDAPLLLGQSAIQKLGAIRLEGNKLTIMQAHGTPPASEKIAEELYQKGCLLFQTEDYKESIKVLNEGLTYTSEVKLLSNIYQGLASAYYEMGDKEMSLQNLLKAQEVDPTNGLVAYNLGVSYYENEDLKSSLAAFKKSVVLGTDEDPFLSAAYAYMGDIYLKTRHNQEAEECFLKSIRISPSSNAYFGLGDIYVQQKQYQKAAENYSKGIKFEPNRLSNVTRGHDLGLALVRAEDDEGAFKAFRRAIEVFFINRGVMEALLAEGPEMEERLNLVKSLTWAKIDSELWMARLAPSPVDRIEIYTQQIFPKSIVYMTGLDYCTLASAYHEIGDAVHALESVNKGLAVFSDNNDLLFQKSLLIPEDNDDERISLLEQILTKEFEYRPSYFDYGTVYNNIAWAYCRKKQYDKRLPYALKSIARNPEHAYSWETLGELYFFLDRYEECVEAMTRCLNCKGTAHHKSAYEFRGNALIKLGKRSEGKADLKNAAKL